MSALGMQAPRLAVWCCVLLQLAASEARITLKDSHYGVTAVDKSDKTGGIQYITEEDDDAPIHIGSTGSRVGEHLAIVLPLLLPYNNTGQSTLAMSTYSTLSSLQNQGYPASAMNTTGGSQWSASMYPFLQYFGGTVMSARKPGDAFEVYLIYYGKWTAAQKLIVESFIKGINPTGEEPTAPFDVRTVQNWWRTMTTGYYEIDSKSGFKRNVTWNVQLKATYDDPGSIVGKGTRSVPLVDKDIRQIVSNAIDNALGDPEITRSAYLVLTDPTIFVEGFCATACSYHSSFRTHSKRVAYSHIGDSSQQCDTLCTYKYFDPYYNPANGDLGVDGLVSWVAHELSSIASNPFQSRKTKPAWVVAAETSPIEAGDLCEWDYGFIGFLDPTSLQTIKTYNVYSGDRYFLIQRNWNRALNACTITGSGLEDQPIPFPS